MFKVGQVRQRGSVHAAHRIHHSDKPQVPATGCSTLEQPAWSTSAHTAHGPTNLPHAAIDHVDPWPVSNKPLGPAASAGQPPLTRRATLAASLVLSLTGWAGCAQPPYRREVNPPLAQALVWQPLSRDLWWIEASGLDADSRNRGHVGHLLLARHEGRIWLIGAGPSPAWARAFDDQVLQRLGQRVTDLALPMAQPEFVLGARGFAEARVWTTQDLDGVLRHRCNDCVAQWRLRLGEAAVDLGDDPVRWADHTSAAPNGVWGPFIWRSWHLRRRDGTPLPGLMWWHADAAAGGAWGLLWGDAPPDLRDGDVHALLDARPDWADIAARWDPAGQGRWLGAQGDLLPATVWQTTSPVFAYWSDLAQAAQLGVEAGHLPGERGPASQGRWPEAWSSHPRHNLNWQRVWRQAEEALFTAPNR